MTAAGADSTPDAVRLRAATRKSRPWLVLLVLAAAFLAGVALVTMLESGSVAASLLRSFPRRFGADGVAMILLGASGLIGATIGAWLLSGTRLSDRALLAAGLALIVLVRGAAVILIEAPLPNDGRAYQELARWLSAGGCCFADRPTGYPALLAGASALLGSGSWVPEALNVAAAGLGGALLFAIVRDTFGRAAAAIALAAFAMLPTQVLLTPVVLADVVYATILLGLCWVGMRIPARPVAAAVAAGAVLALSQYVRPVAPAFLPAIALVPLMTVRPFPRAAVSVALVIGTFGVAMLPAVLHNAAVHGDISVSTSSYGGWSLLMGTNQRSNGRYNTADAQLVASLPGRDLWEKSEVAGAIGIERVTSDPAGSASLALRKFRIMWGTEEYGVAFAFRPEGRERATPALIATNAVAQATYLAIVLAALGSLVLLLRGAGPPAAVVVITIGLLLGEALVHTVLEVKPRYHAQAVPLMIVLAGPAMVWLTQRLRLRS